MKVLITGVAGFIGSHLADRFLADGHEVVGIDNLTTGRRENIPDGTEFIEGNIALRGHWEKLTSISASSTTSIATDCELIVHCAASYDDREKWHRDTDTNVNGAINVAIAARATGARVVYFQTALIYGSRPVHPGGTNGNPNPLTIWTPAAPDNSYAISKYAAEQYLRLSGVPLLTLRLANIYGPRNLSGPVPAFYKRITEGQPCTISDSRRDFVYVDDLVNLVAQAIGEDATGTYHVSTGTDVAIGEVYDAVVNALDAYGGPDPTLVPRAADDAATILLDQSETQRDFSWVATTDLDEGVEKAVEWYREHGVEQVFTHLEMKG